jgi:putative acetyltransferase
MNIEIRRVEPGDYKAVQQVHAQPKALSGTLQLPFPSEESWKERLAKFGDQNIGLVAKHAAYLGMAVHDKWQSKGVGTALMKAAIDLADNWLDLSRLELTVYTDNEPAMRLYKKLGFVVEGTHRKYAFRDGVYVDAYCMARVR